MTMILLVAIALAAALRFYADRFAPDKLHGPPYPLVSGLRRLQLWLQVCANTLPMLVLCIGLQMQVVAFASDYMERDWQRPTTTLALLWSLVVVLSFPLMRLAWATWHALRVPANTPDGNERWQKLTSWTRPWVTAIPCSAFTSTCCAVGWLVYDLQPLLGSWWGPTLIGFLACLSAVCLLRGDRLRRRVPAHNTWQRWAKGGRVWSWHQASLRLIAGWDRTVVTRWYVIDLRHYSPDDSDERAAGLAPVIAEYHYEWYWEAGLIFGAWMLVALAATTLTWVGAAMPAIIITTILVYIGGYSVTDDERNPLE